MPAGQYTITAEAGATFRLSLVWRDPDGDPIDLTTYTARMQVRVSPADDDPLVSLTTGSGITLGGAAGTIDITVAATATDDWDEGRYRYDIEMVSAGGIVTRLLEGPFIVRPEVTR